MAKTKRKPVEVPFDKDGNMMSYGGYSVDHMRPNYTFKSAMFVDSFSRGRSAATITLRDPAGKTYEMFMRQFMVVIENCTIIEGDIPERKWTFVKQGSNYSIKLVLPEEERKLNADRPIRNRPPTTSG